MKSLKNYLTALATLGAVIAVTLPAYAVNSVTVNASATVGGTPVVTINSVDVLTRGTNVPAGSLSWSTPGSGWTVSDQYIKMVTTINTTNGGVQIYTDNTSQSPLANPRYTGTISTNTQATPAGLVNTVLTSQKLPTAWRASTFTLTNVAGIDPNAGAGESFLWFFHEDKAQVRVPGLNASAFGNGDPFVTVYVAPGTPLVENHPDGSQLTRTTTFERSGIHFATGDNPPGQQQFGGFSAAPASTFIYTEADFSSALVGSTYSTNRLILEAFTL